MINRTAISKRTIGDAMLAVENQNTTTHVITLLATSCFEGETVQLETDRHTSADQGAMHHLEIISTLDLMDITATKGYANIR